MSFGNQLPDEYEEFKKRSRTSAPFIYEEGRHLNPVFRDGFGAEPDVCERARSPYARLHTSHDGVPGI